MQIESKYLSKSGSCLPVSVVVCADFGAGTIYESPRGGIKPSEDKHAANVGAKTNWDRFEPTLPMFF